MSKVKLLEHNIIKYKITSAVKSSGIIILGF